MQEDTIAAVATPLGTGGIGVIRISGENAAAVAQRVFKSTSGRRLADIKGYTALYGEFFDTEGRIDEGVALLFRAPKSYTGETVAELSVHGGTFIVKRLLRACLAAGARLAQPGEFTKRAFLNGKLDLIEAESVMGLIGAQSDIQLRLAGAAHTGRVSKTIGSVRDELLKIAAGICVLADYPDEDLPGFEDSELSDAIGKAADTLRCALKDYDAGRVLREGIDTAIVGRPNVGKSTLMNLLSGTQRSIVTEIAGTTRDIIEDTVQLGDITLRLADTAGIRMTADTVEAAGVERARQRMESAQLILAVFDAGKPLCDDDTALLEQIKSRTAIVILNKYDRPAVTDDTCFKGFTVIPFCARDGTGLKRLETEIARITGAAALNADAAVLISERQHDCVRRALDALCEAESALKSGFTHDAVGVCVDDALAALLELTGERVTGEVTNEIFKRFCVGK